MTKRLTIIASLLLAFYLYGCADTPKKQDSTALLNSNWSTIEDIAQGSTVRFYMYGGFANVNQWIDTYVAEQVKERFNITLVRVPMDAGIFVNKLLTEQSAGKEIGSIDLLWINGENFKTTKEAGVLFGPFAPKLPNFIKYVDKGLAAYDFGFPTEGYEAPYGRAQFVFEYDTARTPNPPRNFAELKDWIRDNPGKFTYPQPPDFTGSAFIRQAFYAVTSGPDQYLHGWDQSLFDKRSPLLWRYLNALKPDLWQGGTTYPKSSAELDTLFARGEVDLNMSYHPLHAQSQILNGNYPKTVRNYIMSEGSLYNLHFTAIPANAPNKAGAMVVANFLLSPEAQLSKFKPKNWGDFSALSLQMLTLQKRTLFRSIDLGDATLPMSELEDNSVPEIPAQYLEALEKGWEEHVLR